MPAEVVVVEGPREVARTAAERVARALRTALEARGWAQLCLPAGRALSPVLDELARASLDWARVEFFFSEERGVPHGHPASAWALAAGRLLDNLRIAEDQLVAMQGDAADPAAAAADYAERLPERFDVMLLQPSPDGSLGALHPGSPAFEPGAPAVLALELEATPRRRLLMGPAPILAAREVVVTAVGPEHAGLLERARIEAPEHFPAALLAERCWVLDRWAAGPSQAAERRLTPFDREG